MTTVRLYRPQGTDRVAVVSIQPSWTHSGRFMIAVARGPARRKLGPEKLYGPVDADEAEGRLAELVDHLAGEGFVRGGLAAQLAALDAPAPRKRALAALRLGWRAEPAAVEPLLAAAERARRERSAVVDALGAIGDARAIPVARQDAERKLLSRRRSGAEALRALGDVAGLEMVRQRARQLLPETLRTELDALPTEVRSGEPVSRLVEALMAVPLEDRGLALDSLYDIDTPLGVAAVREALGRLDIDRPHLWRYVKSVLKRSLLRHDAATFGRVIHRIERVGRTASGTQATLKSGYDGKLRQTVVFSRRTRDYLRRAAWRYLRRLAAYRPHLYPPAAAEAIVQYDLEDEVVPKGRYGAYASCYLLHRVLWAGGSRYEVMQRSLRFRLRQGAPAHAPEDAREEAYPQLWDADPEAYVRLLEGSRLIVVQEFALKAVQERHRFVLQNAPGAQVAALLGAPHPPTVALGIAELKRRFDPTRPDWSLLQMLLDDGREPLRDLGLEWLATTAGLWTRDPAHCVAVLTAKDAQVRATATRLCIDGLRDAPVDCLRALAEHVLATLHRGETTPDTHQALVAVVSERLVESLRDLSSVEELMDLLGSGSVAAKAIAAQLLACRDDAVVALGLPRITALARHPIPSVRREALVLLRRALPNFGEDPSLLLEVAECDWPDSRAAAVALLREIDLSRLQLEALLELLDSTRVEVQALGRELLLASRERWDPAAVVTRLLEHPHPSMRDFTLQLIEEHLDGDLTKVAVSEDFYRKVLFDLSPSRRLKRRVLELLASNGERDEQQAVRAIAVLGEVLESQTREDFEQALAALARIHLAFPQAPLPAGLLIGATG